MMSDNAALPLLVCAADLRHAPVARRILEQHFHVEYLSADVDAVAKSLQHAHAYFACLQVPITADLLKQSPKLKAIVTPSTGLDHIDLNAAKSFGVEVLGLKDDRQLLDKITATAELAWTLILTCARRFSSAIDSVKKGLWARDALRGHQIAYKTLGILGCGRLGSIVAQYAQAFRMRVIACDHLKINQPNVEQVSFDQLLAQSDILTIHIHLTEENTKLINSAAFAKMKDQAILVNTSRGAIIDEAALLDSLESGKLLAAGLDVIDGEWMEDLTQHPLVQYMQNHDNLIIVPHLGGVTYESQQKAFEASAHKIVQYFSTRT